MTTGSVYMEIWQNGAAAYAFALGQVDDVPGNVAPAYGLADPLAITQALTAGERLPISHPLPEELTFHLIAPDAATYAGVSIGDPVVAAVYTGNGFTGSNVVFYGRIASLAADPHDLGVIYTVTCLDYLADLAAYTVGAVAYPAEAAKLRMDRMVAEAGLPKFGATAGALTFVHTGPMLVARPVGTTDLLSALLEVLDSWIIYGFRDENWTNYASVGVSTGHRAYIRPNIGAGNQLDPATPFLYGYGAPFPTRRVRYAPPARITNVSGTYEVTVAVADSSPSTGAPIIDGGSVAMSSTFSQDKSRGMANRIVATDSGGNPFVFDWRSLATPGSLALSQFTVPIVDFPAQLQQVDSIVDPSVGADQVALTYVTPFRPDVRASYTPSSMEYQAWKDVGTWRRPQLSELLTITRAATAHNPTNREWLSGIVTGTTLTVQKGRVTIDVETMPNVEDFNQQAVLQGASLGVVQWNSPAIAVPTFAQLSTRDTYADYMIVRGS